MSAPTFALRVRLALHAFDLDVDVTSTARSLAVFGPSGAGKTSLLEVVAGWRAPAVASIAIDGHVLDRDGTRAPIEARGVGYVPQGSLLFPHWDVRRNVIAGGARGRTPHELERDVARTVDVLEIGPLLDRPVRSLSGGEAQRVALARALVSRPRVLLLDEPLGSLDRPLRARVLPYLLRARAEFDVPTLLVSHDPTEVQALCDEVLVLRRGRVESRGRPDDVLRVALAGEPDFENVLAGRVSAITGDTATVRVDGGELCVPAARLVVGGEALVAIGSEEILVAREVPRRISARNVVTARVQTVDDSRDGSLRLEARLGAHGDGARMSVSLTRAARDELELARGLEVHLVFKTTACRVLSTALAPAASRASDPRTTTVP